MRPSRLVARPSTTAASRMARASSPSTPVVCVTASGWAKPFRRTACRTRNAGSEWCPTGATLPVRPWTARSGRGDLAVGQGEGVVLLARVGPVLELDDAQLLEAVP